MYNNSVLNDLKNKFNNYILNNKKISVHIIDNNTIIRTSIIPTIVEVNVNTNEIYIESGDFIFALKDIINIDYDENGNHNSFYCKNESMSVYFDFLMI